jgi:regulator of sigma E protease
LTIIAFIIILSVLIFVHELGHFIVAKRAGITVEEFAIGFPPRMVKLWQDEGQITLDGQQYVIGRKMNVPRTVQPGATVYAETGLDKQGRPALTRIDLVEVVKQGDKRQQGSEARILDAISFKSSQSVAAKEGMPTYQVDALTRPTEYSINWIPLGGYVRMVGEEDPTDPGSFASKSKKIRFAVLVAGSLMNLVTAVVFFTLTSMSGVPEPVTGTNLLGEPSPIAQTVVTEVIPDTPAAAAGLQSGDIILGAGEIEFNHVGDLIYYVDQRKGQTISLQIEREGQIFTTDLTPRVNPPAGQGAMGVGITYEGTEVELTYYPVHRAFVRGLQQTGEYIALTFYLPVAIIQNIIPAEAARPTGPVGIYQQTGSAVDAAVQRDWWFPILWLTAILSTALAITNLLPLPALDGGRIMFVLIEAVRGKRIAPEKEGAIHFIGLALLLMLMLVISYYDISNPIPAIDWGSFF